MVICHVLLTIYKFLLSPCDDIFCGIVLNCNRKNFFRARFYIGESLFRSNLNINCYKFDLFCIKLDFIFWIVFRDVLIDISIIAVDLKSIYFIILLKKITTISYSYGYASIYRSAI